MPTYRSLSTMSVLLGKFRHGPAGFPAPHSCLETISNIILHPLPPPSPSHPDTRRRPREYESRDLYVSRGVIFIKRRITSPVQRPSRILGERILFALKIAGRARFKSLRREWTREGFDTLPLSPSWKIPFH